MVSIISTISLIPATTTRRHGCPHDTKTTILVNVCPPPLSPPLPLPPAGLTQISAIKKQAREICKTEPDFLTWLADNVARNGMHVDVNVKEEEGGLKLIR